MVGPREAQALALSGALLSVVLAGCGGDSGASSTGQGGGTSSSTSGGGQGGQGGAGGTTSSTSGGGQGGAGGGQGGAFAIDECAMGTAECAPDAICVDTPSYYACECKPGYEGDGKSCADVDECSALLFDCDPNAHCENVAGSYACSCPAGFTGDGKSCEATYVALSAGQLHACAIRSDKTLWCWGLNTSGQVGTGTSDAVFVRPAAAGDGASWVAVSAGAAFTCALDEAKAIACWGSNASGQLGDGTTTTRTSPTPITGGFADWIALDAGSTHTCGIREGGALYCWGSNNRGQLGDGSNESHSAPTLVSEGPWIAVSAGSEFTCALRADHTLWCFGLGTSRQLGDGNNVNSAVPVQDKTLSASWASVSAGNAFACGQKLDGSRFCWGTNTLGQGGDGTTTAITQPKQVDADTDWAALALGDLAGCGLRSSGALWCWGDGSLGQTGQPGAEAPTLAPVKVGDGADWTAITGGLRFFCGLRAAGKLFCWGSNSRSALGLGYSSDRNEPTLVDDTTTWERVEVQLDDGCAIRKNGALFCWGRNVSGQLGDGSQVTRTAPVSIGAGKAWKRVAVGRTHSCGIALENGVEGLYCWGQDVNGEQGNGAGATPSLLPAPVVAPPGAPSPWTEVAAGLNHSCALRKDGTLWCWGRNALGQLGDTTLTARSEPKQVLPAGASNWVDVATSGEHTCALRASGTLWCWGRNDVGQLGLGDGNSPVSTPTQVGNAFYEAIDAGANHTCAVATNGTLWCWGRNASGELGLGNSVGPVLVPTQVGAESDWVRPVLGQGTSTCALKGNGDLYCWGTGSYGQLGLGSTSSFNTPQKVPSVLAWTRASLGLEHGCGIKGDGRLFCWGASYGAQLGSGIPLLAQPTAVLDPP
jgi:alpha-tubulin suppressor-like RCC1 family protein